MAVRSEKEAASKKRCWWVYCHGFISTGFIDLNANIQTVYSPIPPQTSSAGSSSSRTLRCPRCRPPSKCPGTVTSSWQQVGRHRFLLSAKMRLNESFLTGKRHLIPVLFIFRVLPVLGTYKPRIRCYDTHQLSLKFERCLDSDGKPEIPRFFNIVKYVRSVLNFNVKNVFSHSKLWHLTLCLMTTPRWVLWHPVLIFHAFFSSVGKALIIRFIFLSSFFLYIPTSHFVCYFMITSWCFCTVTATWSSTPSRDTTTRREFQSLEGTFHITPPPVTCILWGQGKNLTSRAFIWLAKRVLSFYYCSFFQFRGVQAQSWTGKVPELASNRFCVCILLPCFDFKCLHSTWKWLVFALNWYFCLRISKLFIRENNVCDINPVHYLFATGTSEVSLQLCISAQTLLCALLSIKKLSVQTLVCETWWGYFFIFPPKRKKNNDTFHFPASAVCICWPFPFTSFPSIRDHQEFPIWLLLILFFFLTVK